MCLKTNGNEARQKNIKQEQKLACKYIRNWFDNDYFSISEISSEFWCYVVQINLCLQNDNIENILCYRMAYLVCSLTKTVRFSIIHVL